MTQLTGPALLLVCVCVCVSSADDKDAVRLRSKFGDLSVARGSSVKLSCEAAYYVKLCGLLHVEWRLQEGKQLTDPIKYPTTVNETLLARDRRNRQVLTEIVYLTSEDSGRYQCIATCADVESAVGRVLILDVRGRSSSPGCTSSRLLMFSVVFVLLSAQ